MGQLCGILSPGDTLKCHPCGGDFSIPSKLPRPTKKAVGFREGGVSQYSVSSASNTQIVEGTTGDANGEGHISTPWSGASGGGKDRQVPSRRSGRMSTPWAGAATSEASDPTPASSRNFDGVMAEAKSGAMPSPTGPPSGLGFSVFSRQSKALYLVAAGALCCLMLAGVWKGSSAVCLYVGVIMVFFVFGDLLYSRLLANVVFRLSEDEVTPAHQEKFQGHPDYVATPSYVLFGHHWTSITGAAPIIGPATACYYGWLPAMLWVVLGVLLAGAVHDFGVMVVSARNDGRSIGDLAGIIVSWRARILFLLLIIFLSWIVVAVFMNAIANLFIANPETVLPVNAEIPLAVVMGVCTQLAQQNFQPGKAKGFIIALSVCMLVVLYALVFVGVQIEADSGEWVDGTLVDPVFGFALHSGKGSKYLVRRTTCRDAVSYKRDSDGNPMEPTCSWGAKQWWTLYLTVYALAASVLPVWIMLQPRDFINSHQLKVCMVLMLFGLIAKGPSIDAEAIRSDVAANAMDSSPIFPMLFTTIACGSVSGFHGLVSSGVTSKQLHKMPDARSIGYGAMLGESALAALVIIICCSSGTWATSYASWPVNWAQGFIPGAGTFLEALGLSAKASKAIVVVLVVSFAATTLDSAMRIQRVLVGELGGIIERSAPSSWAGLGKTMQNIYVAGLLSALPAFALANSRIVDSLWNIFGATNQLLACLSLITVAVYLWRFHSFNVWYAVPFILPAVWLVFVIFWALGRTIVVNLDPMRRVDEEIDWFTTIPTYPSIMILFAIFGFGAAILVEVAVYFIGGNYKTDAQISPDTGRIEAPAWEQGNESDKKGALHGLGCC